MTPRARWGALALLAAPAGAWALGLGDIELRSALTQPLEAEIQLVSATALELEELRVSLAAPETFDRYGIDRPAFLSGLEFQVATDAQGRDIIRVSSRQPISEPFVTMLVEVIWSRGRLLREYTVLLDPPVLLPAPAVTETVQPAQTRVPEPARPAATISRPTAEPALQPVTEPATAQRVPPALAESPDTYGPVQRGDTLWGLASRFRPAGVSMNQMMVAMFQANPRAFAGNMNLLRQGSSLRIPAAGEARSIAVAEANQEAARQTEAWQGGRQQAQLRLVAPDEQAPAGAITAGVDSATAAEVTALEGEVNTLRNELAESRRLIELRNQELLELQARLSATEEALDVAPEPTAEIPEAEPLFADEVESAVEPEPEITAEPETVAEPPAVTARVVTTPSGPSLVSRILGWVTNPLLLIGLGVLALLGAAVWYLRHRQEAEEDVTGRWEALEAEAEEDEEGRETTERLRANIPVDENFVVVEQPVAPIAGAEPVSLLDDELAVPEEPASAAAPIAPPADDTLSSQTVINLDQADPLAEADFHMAYGLYDQAAELVSKALELDPSRRELKLKLLEVFFVWGNKESFLDTAQSLRGDIGDGADPDWDKVVIMGKQICPDEALFEAVGAAVGTVDLDLDAGEEPALDLALEQDESPGVDLDLGDIGGADVELELEAADQAEPSVGGADLDFEIGDQTAAGLEGLAEPEQAEAEVDLDIGDQTAAGLEAALMGDAVDASAQTMPDPDAAPTADTQESPTLESSFSPTVDMEASELPTVETPTLETPSPGDTLESPTVEMGMEGTSELPTLEQPGFELDAGEASERTAEINLDDLGLDVDNLADLPVDLGQLTDDEADEADEADEEGDEGEADTREQLVLSADEELLSATGVTQVLEQDQLEDFASPALGDDEATQMAPEFDEDTAQSKTDVLQQSLEEASGETSVVKALGEPAAGSGLDLDLDDFSSALDGGETVEQPGQTFSSEIFDGDGQTGVDTDVRADVPASEEPTVTEQMTSLDAQTMTEVGTKLDLARAYIDMADLEGARSLLEEVVDEGDPEQQEEAKNLIASL